MLCICMHLPLSRLSFFIPAIFMGESASAAETIFMVAEGDAEGESASAAKIGAAVDFIYEHDSVFASSAASAASASAASASAASAA
jgi:hypothetical protein